MASLDQDKLTGTFYIRFRFGGRAFKRSLKAKDTREAEGIRGRVEETIVLLERGRLTLPPTADPATFILSDGRLEQKVKLQGGKTVGQLLEDYERKFPFAAKEANTRRVEEVHANHLRRLLGATTPLSHVTLATIQEYVDARSAESWKGKNIRAETIRKEVATLRMVWAWAVRLGHVTEAVPHFAGSLSFPKGSEKPPFQTFAQAHAAVQRGGLSTAEVRAIFDRVFLSPEEVCEVLAGVRDRTEAAGWLYPMFLFAAHTGARRSEMMRSQVEDFNFALGVIQIREKKKSKLTHTFRSVDLTPELANAFEHYFGTDHPGGPHALCRVPSIPLTERAVQFGFRSALQGTKWHVLRGFHVFRHSFASNLAAAGVDQRVIDELMGHQTEAMRKRYRHLFPDQRRAAIARVFMATKPQAAH